MKKILITEDDEAIGSLIEGALESSDYEIFRAASGEQTFAEFERIRPDLLILDLGLPDMDGIEICKNIRRTDENTPIFILSARTDEIDRILGLQLGADDYITKPFSVRELRTRIDGFFRRWERLNRSAQDLTESIVRGPLRIDPESRRIAINNKAIFSFGRKEFEILKLLAESPGKIFSRETILNEIWGTEWEGSERIIDTHIKRIRSKLEELTGNPEWIITIRAAGYRFTTAYEQISNRSGSSS